MRSARKLALVLAVGVVTATSTSGCAYFSGVLPVEGVDPNIYYAVSDVLVKEKRAVKLYPQCVLDPNKTTQTCKGTMMDGRPILATGDQSDKSLPFTVKIGDTTIFTGSANEVLAEAAEKQ